MLITSRMRVLLFIYKTIKEKGVSPRFRDIANAVGLHLSSIQWHIKTLKNDGYLRHDKYSKRSIELTQKGLEFAEALINAGLDQFGSAKNNPQSRS